MEFTLRTTLPAHPQKVFEAWLSSDGHSQMTGGDADITDKEGESFSAWDGYISGKNITIVPFTKIVQAWRTTEFSKNQENSLLELIFREVDGQTELTLHHSNIPEDGTGYRQGWVDHYFEPMKSYFTPS